MDMNLSDITPGTHYASPAGTYVATSADHLGAYVTVALAPSGHTGAPFTARFSTNADSYRWSA